MEKQCISSSDSDTDSTVISNSESSHCVETDQWDFGESIEGKIVIETLSGELWSRVFSSPV